jgi:flagellar hook-associated protein 1
MSILSTLSIAAQALKANQSAIQTASHNLANVSTSGYSRQRVDLVSSYPSFEGGVFLGQGVDVAGIQRIVDRFAEGTLLTVNADFGYAQAQSRALASLEDSFPLGGGIDSALSDFFGALSDLANNPAGSAERVSLIGKANALGQSLAQTRQSIAGVQQNLDADITSALQRVNTVVESIAKLNRQISLAETGGEIANDFRDQRQTLLQELTQLTGATAREDSNGELTVVAGGLLLVGGNRFASLSGDSLNAAGLHEITYRSPDGSSFDATALFSQGKIGALLNLRDEQLPDALNHLDQLAKTMVDQINAQHALGFDLNGAAGGDFFAPITTLAGAAANVRVASAVTADPRLIAAAGTATTVPGDNRNLLALTNLQSSALPSLGGLSLQDFYNSLVGDIGSRAESAQAQLDFQQALLTQAQARRESVSGVKSDEEMTKLIQFQRAFESASMVVRTADEMYQAIIDMVR